MDMLARAITCQFEDFLLDLRAGALFRLDARGVPTPVPLGSRAFNILCVLIERRDDFVSKQEMMDAVWPNQAVEESNLTVQMSALRRMLDVGRAQGSCIQTIAGRGYRFLPRVTHSSVTTIVDANADPRPPDGEPAPRLSGPGAGTGPTDSLASPRDRRRFTAWAVCLFVAASLATLAWYVVRSPATPDARPRLSVVVLPFRNLSGDSAEDYLAEGITDDLTTDLAHLPDAFVIARESAYTYKDKATDVRQIGHELSVRYVLEGSVRKLGITLRVNAQLTSAETGAHLWSDRFDEQIADLAAGQEQIVTRMRAGLGLNLVEIANARGLRERPTDPDAFDLVLRARSIQNLPPSLQRKQEALALYERALVLDPSSVDAMIGVAYFLIDSQPTGGWGSFEAMQRAERLLTQARAISPDADAVLNVTVYWLRSVGRCQEAMEAAEQAIHLDPNRRTGVYNELAVCKTWAGHAEEELALQQEANRRNPRSPWMYVRHRHMGFASLMLGKDQDAIMHLQRSLAMNPDDDGFKHLTYRLLAAAYARTGQTAKAKYSLAEADRLWPYDTVRGHWPDDLSSNVYVEQIKGFQSALRLAGERDHAAENADFGVPADRVLHSEVAGLTPTDAPGVKTIRTADLARLLAETRPVVVDTATYSWGRSIPGAIGLKNAGLGGSFTDAAQNRLRSTMRTLSDGDLNRPIVAVGWNCERFDGRNLALRLVALGYVNVYWYRGGREAWEVNGLPETEMAITNW